MQRNMDIPLLNPYGLLLKRRRAEVFSFLILRACCNWNRKIRHLLRGLKGRPGSGAANHFKEEFFNIYKILRLRCTAKHQDKDAAGFAAIGRPNRRPLRKTGLLRLREETMMQRSAEKMLETWRWIENRQVCIWIDGCYIQ